ncbi:MAG: ion channel [Draconibacterium sp.]|nr:ion channel [Draconibacterium sp.]
MFEKVNNFREARINRKYEILLLSLLLLLFGDIFFPFEFDSSPILVIQNVFASTILFYGKKRWRWPLYILLFTLVFLEIINLFAGLLVSKYLFSILYILYFVILSIEVYREILKNKGVTIGMVAAVLSGFILLALMGGYLFIIIEMIVSGSFTNLSEGVTKFSDLIYFSFITVLSVGYGDISPITPLAKKAAVLIGLLGHFYSVVVIGIVIGKFIAKNE